MAANGEFYILIEVTSNLHLALARLGDRPRVLLRFVLLETSGPKFDKYRQPVVWLDDKAEVDMGLCKAMDALSREFGAGDTSYSFEERDVSGVIWHGVRKQGLGFFGKLMSAASMSVRVYYDDYTSSDHVLTAEQFGSFKSQVAAAIGGI